MGDLRMTVVTRGKGSVGLLNKFIYFKSLLKVRAKPMGNKIYLIILKNHDRYWNTCIVKVSMT